jgi:enamine deaminase RidA (YjgF/YER057c/UK114 family)
MTFHNSIAFIVTAAQREAVLTIGRALGYEGGLVVQLSASGSAPATHYGAHAWAADEFVALITGDWPVPDGVPAETVAAAKAALTVSVQTPCESPLAHFEAVCASAGLVRIEA